MAAVPVTTYDLEKNEGADGCGSCPERGSGAPLTAPDASASEPAFSPDGKRLAFIRKRDPADKAQLHVMPLDGGEAEKLTDLPLGVVRSRAGSPDGKRIVFVAPLLKGHLTPEATRGRIERRDKDPVKAHVTEDRVSSASGTPGSPPARCRTSSSSTSRPRSSRDLTPDSTRWFDWMDPAGQYDIAPDGKEIAFAGELERAARTARCAGAMFTVPIGGGRSTCLTPDHPADDWRPRYSPDGTTHRLRHAARSLLLRRPRAARCATIGRPATQRVLHESWDRSPAHWEFFGATARSSSRPRSEGRVSLFARRGGGEPPTR